jgi:hypothetical protein
MPVRDIDRGYRALMGTVRGFRTAAIAVGILEKDGEAPKDGVDELGEVLTLLQVAIWNEFGTEDGHVPARSFIRAWFDGAEPQIREKLREQLRLVVARHQRREVAFERVGLWCVGQIQARIAAGIEPENRPSTVAQKGSDKPLINRGQLRSAIAYALRERQ